jgi:hypothetical protein
MCYLLKKVATAPGGDCAAPPIIDVEVVDEEVGYNWLRRVVGFNRLCTPPKQNYRVGLLWSVVNLVQFMWGHFSC